MVYDRATQPQRGWGRKGPLELIRFKTPARAGSALSRLPRNMSRWFLSISVGKLCQCSVTLTVKRVSWCSERTSCVSVYAWCFWSCHLVSLRRAWISLLHTLPSGSTVGTMFKLQKALLKIPLLFKFCYTSGMYF